MRRPGFVVMGLLIAAVSGVLTFAISKTQRMQTRVAYSYLPVAARVLSSTVESHPGSAANPRYFPRVEYRYEVNGTTYQSTRLAWTGRTYGSRQEVEQFVQEHPVGATFQAYYDPEAPDASVILNTRPGPEAWLVPFGTGLLGLLALASAVYGALPPGRPSTEPS